MIIRADIPALLRGFAPLLVTEMIEIHPQTAD
jgi:hypothetical protein